DAHALSGKTPTDILTSVIQHILVSNLKFIGSNLDDAVQSTVGNDHLFGGKGDDSLDGGKSKDILIGGAGDDTFHFIAGDGHDTITDFDADGGLGHQDLIAAEYSSVTSTDQVGDNTVIHFGHGDTLTLLHVDASHITGDDFVV